MEPHNDGVQMNPIEFTYLPNRQGTETADHPGDISTVMPTEADANPLVQVAAAAKKLKSTICIDILLTIGLFSLKLGIAEALDNLIRLSLFVALVNQIYFMCKISTKPREQDPLVIHGIKKYYIIRKMLFGYGILQAIVYFSSLLIICIYVAFSDISSASCEGFDLFLEYLGYHLLLEIFAVWILYYRLKHFKEGQLSLTKFFIETDP